MTHIEDARNEWHMSVEYGKKGEALKAKLCKNPDFIEWLECVEKSEAHKKNASKALKEAYLDDKLNNVKVVSQDKTLGIVVKKMFNAAKAMHTDEWELIISNDPQAINVVQKDLLSEVSQKAFATLKQFCTMDKIETRESTRKI